MRKTENFGMHFMKLAVIVVLFFILGIASGVKVRAEETNKVRVGFWERNGYHMQAEDGSRSGYGYDMLQLMARYSDMNYEYVGYGEKTRAELLEMLHTGEIDMMTSVHMIPERLDDFSISEIDTGDCHTMMTVQAGNNRIEAGNYKSYDGMRVAIQADGVHDVCFYEFAEEQGFSYIPVCFNTTEEVVEALKAGEVDATVTPSIRVLDENEWYLESFHEEPLYVIVKKGNEELLNTVNKALRELDLNEPDWRLVLQEKYFPKDQGHLLNLSPDEKKYLAQLTESGKVLKVLVNPNRYPYSYLEDGEYKGIMIDVFADLAAKTNIKYEYIIVKDRAEYMDMLVTELPDICIDCPNDFSTAENQGYMITDPYINIGYSWLYRADNEGDAHKLTRISHTSLKESERETVEGMEYIEYLTVEECVEAVRKGEADGFTTNTLNAEKIIWEDESGKMQTMVRDYSQNFCIGTDIDIDRRLLSILNKAVQNMDEDLIEQKKEKYSYLGERPFSFARLRHEYPEVIFFIIIFCAVIMMFAVYTLLQKKYRDTIRKEMEAARRANEAKSEFISRMSHDIRTPINGISGMIEVAERNIDDRDKVTDCLRKMSTAVRQLGNLVDDVLNITKMEAISEKNLDQPFNLKDQLEYCTNVINGKLVGRILTFEFDFDDIRHKQLIGSDVYLNEVLTNVLSNCIKYTRDGGLVRFTVKEEETDNPDKARFCFKMEDTGIGMSREFLETIYEPFAQETSSSRSKFEGTGLGMTIVKKLLDRMGGTIDIVSYPGEGTKFTIYIEFQIDHSAEEEEEEAAVGEAGEEAGEQAATDLSGVRVLVVDDIELNIEIVQSILEDEGAIVTTAYNGAEAVESFAASEVGSLDLILMDIRMPVMDGIEATRAIRSMDRADAKTIPIIALTANSFETDVEKTMEAGMNGHKNKPVDVEDLILTVASCRK